MRDWRAVAIIVIGSIGAFLYSNFILDYILPGHDSFFEVISELETAGNPNASVLRTTDVIGGLFMLVPLPYVWAALPADGWRATGVVSTAVFAIGSALSGIVALPCGGETTGCDSAGEQFQRWVHDGASTISATALFIGAAAIAIGIRRVGPRWLRLWGWFTFWVGGVVGTVLFGGAAAVNSSSWQTGAAQRFQVLVMSAWIVCLAVYAAKDGLAAIDGRRTDVTHSPQELS